MLNQQNKRILFVSPFFYPEFISTGKYNTFLVQKFVEKGYELTVVCSYPFYPAWHPKFTDETLVGVKIIRGGLKISYPKSAVFRRLLLELWFTFYFFRASKNINASIDIVVAICPPVFFTYFVGLFFRKSKKIVIVHDLLGVMSRSSNGFSRLFVAFIMKRLESFLLRRFDKVVCLSESMRRVGLKQYGLKKDTCEVYYPFTTIENDKHEHSLLRIYFPAGFTHLVYSGALGEKQKPRELYRFFTKICKLRKNFYCHIFSSGPIFDELKQLNRNEKIRFHGLVAENHLNDLYACSDIQILPQAQGIGAGAFPSKLPNLIAAGVPILAICDKDSEVGEIIKMSGAGKSVSCWDTQQLLEACDLLLESEGEGQRAIRKARAKKFIAAKFDVNRLIASIIGE